MILIIDNYVVNNQMFYIYIHLFIWFVIKYNVKVKFLKIL